MAEKENQLYPMPLGNKEENRNVPFEFNNMDDINDLEKNSFISARAEQIGIRAQDAGSLVPDEVLVNTQDLVTLGQVKSEFQFLAFKIKPLSTYLTSHHTDQMDKCI